MQNQQHKINYSPEQTNPIEDIFNDDDFKLYQKSLESQDQYYYKNFKPVRQKFQRKNKMNESLQRLGMSNLFINNNRKLQQQSINQFSDESLLNTNADLDPSIQDRGPEIMFTTSESRKYSQISRNLYQNNTIESNTVVQYQNDPNYNNQEFLQLPPNPLTQHIQDGNYNQIRQKIQAAKIINLYGETNSKNKKLRNTLKKIIEKTNLQEVYENRKDLIKFEQALLNSADGAFSGSSSKQQLSVNRVKNSEQNAVKGSPKQDYDGQAQYKKRQPVGYENLNEFKRINKQPNIQRKSLSQTRAFYYNNNNNQNNNRKNNQAPELPQIPVTLKLSFDRGEKIQKGMKELIKRTSTLDSQASQIDLNTINVPSSYHNLESIFQDQTNQGPHIQIHNQNSTTSAFSRHNRLIKHQTLTTASINDQQILRQSPQLTKNYEKKMQLKKKIQSSRESIDALNINSRNQDLNNETDVSLYKNNINVLRRQSQQHYAAVSRKLTYNNESVKQSLQMMSKQERDMKFKELMNSNWQNQIQKLQDEIKLVKTKEKKHLMKMQKKPQPEENVKQERNVKFNLPEI